MRRLAIGIVLVAGVAYAGEHSHRFVRSNVESTDCCARWDVEKGRSEDGSPYEMKRCGKSGVRVTVTYKCDCGESKQSTSTCEG